MNILTHDEAKRLSQSSTDPLEVIRNVEAAVIIKLAGSQAALKDEIRLIWQPKCDALRAALQPPAPGEAAREYMTGYSDGREWAGATSQAQQAQSVPEPVLQWCDKCGEGTVQGLCRGKLDDCKFKQAQPAAQLAAAQGQEPVDAVPLSDMVEGSHPSYGRGLFATDNCVKQFYAAPIPQQPSVPEGWKQAVALAYGHLWHVNNEPMAPIPLRSSETAAYAARKQLRDLLTS